MQYSDYNEDGSRELDDMTREDLDDLIHEEMESLERALRDNVVDPAPGLLKAIRQRKYGLMHSFHSAYDAMTRHNGRYQEDWKVVDFFKDNGNGIIIMRGVGLRDHANINFNIKAKHWYELQEHERRMILGEKTSRQRGPDTVFIVFEDDGNHSRRIIETDAERLYARIDHRFPTDEMLIAREERGY